MWTCRLCERVEPICSPATWPKWLSGSEFCKDCVERRIAIECGWGLIKDDGLKDLLLTEMVAKLYLKALKAHKERRLTWRCSVVRPPFKRKEWRMSHLTVRGKEAALPLGNWACGNDWKQTSKIVSYGSEQCENRTQRRLNGRPVCSVCENALRWHKPRVHLLHQRYK